MASTEIKVVTLELPKLHEMMIESAKEGVKQYVKEQEENQRRKVKSRSTKEVIMAQIVFFTAVAIAMLIVLGNSFQMKYQGKHGKGVSDDEY